MWLSIVKLMKKTGICSWEKYQNGNPVEDSDRKLYSELVRMRQHPAPSLLEMIVSSASEQM